jgi:hypothetical protein
MYFQGAGHLVRINITEWYNNSPNCYTLFDSEKILDPRIHYIQKNIIREVIVTQHETMDDIQMYQMVIVTTDRDPNLGKFQTITFRGPFNSITDLEKAFLLALK